MKKLIAIICAVAIGFSVTGCGQSKDDSGKRLSSKKLSGEITVSCYDTMVYKDFLEKAAKAFEKKNPGTKIKVESFAPMPEVKTMEDGSSGIFTIPKEEEIQKRADYISKINTELMSGKGADVLAMDILPYYKYADAGQLEDLQLYMDADNDFDIKDYRKNILDAMKYHKAQYVMPLDYMFHYLTYDTSIFNEKENQSLQKNSKFTYDQLIEAGKKPLKRANINSENIRMFEESEDFEVFKGMLSVDYGKYIDIENRKVNLADGSFAKLLKSAQKYKDNLQSRARSLEEYQKFLQQKILYKTKDNFCLLVTGAGDESNDKPLGFLTNKKGNINFKYTQAYGINSNSENKALAWAFIKFLISDQVQLPTASLPINNTARIKKAKLDILGMIFNDETVDQSKELTAKQKKAYDSYNELVEKYSHALNCCPIEDDTINAMIEKEVVYYFDGSRTAEQVASSLQEKIELYLNE